MESHSHSRDLTNFPCLAHVTKITKEFIWRFIHIGQLVQKLLYTKEKNQKNAKSYEEDV